MKDRLARSVFWISWSRGVGQLISFLSTLLIARLLSPSDYGLIALAGIWTGIMSLISEMGLGAAIVQFRDLEEDDLHACFWLTMSLATLAYLMLYVSAPALERWFATDRLADVLRATGLTLPLTAIAVVPESLLRKELAFDRLSQANLLATLVTVPVTLGMAWSGAGVWALVAGALIAPAVQTVATFWFVGWLPAFRLGGPRSRELMQYSLATLGTRLCWAVYQQADTFVLGKVSGGVILGFYSVAKDLAALPVSRISTVVNQLASPVMAELQTSLDALRTSLCRSLRLVTAVTLPLCIGLLLEADDFVEVILTTRWAPAVPMLRILCLYSVVSSVAVLFVPVLMARYRAGFVLRYMLAQLALMPLTFWLGALWFGGVGVAAAWALVYPIAFTWLARETLREVDIPWPTLLSQCGPQLAATGLMVLAVLLGRFAWAATPAEGALGRLAVMVTLGAAVYVAGLWWIGGPLRREILEVAGWIFRGGRVALTRK